MSAHEAGAVGMWGVFADALHLLARLHDREADPALLDGLRRNAICEWLATALPPGAAAKEATRLGDALTTLSSPLNPADEERLAADFADIYLTHGYRASPNGSVWLSEDRLERQEPMFEARKWYRHYGVEAPDWRQRPDDNLAFQIQFLAHLLRLGEAVPLADAARFLDAGLLRWLPRFVELVDQRAATAFYRSAARLTLTLVDDIRDALERETGIIRPLHEASANPDTGQKQESAAYFPGQSESW